MSHDDNSRVAATGQALTIVWGTDARARSVAKDFYDALNTADQVKVMALFQRLADHGQIHNREKFKGLGRQGHDLWEFKSFQLRFLGDFRPGGRFVVAFAVRKKKDEHTRADLEAAVRLLREHDEKEKRR